MFCFQPTSFPRAQLPLRRGSQFEEATARLANSIKAREEFFSGDGLAAISFSNCFEELFLVFRRQVNLLLGLMSQDGNGLAFSEIEAFDDYLAAYYGTGGYLHIRMVLR